MIPNAGAGSGSRSAAPPALIRVPPAGPVQAYICKVHNDTSCIVSNQPAPLHEASFHKERENGNHISEKFKTQCTLERSDSFLGICVLKLRKKRRKKTKRLKIIRSSASTELTDPLFCFGGEKYAANNMAKQGKSLGRP